MVATEINVDSRKGILQRDHSETLISSLIPERLNS
jgi:hypothetical protein